MVLQLYLAFYIKVNITVTMFSYSLRSTPTLHSIWLVLAVEGFKRSYMYVAAVTPFDYHIQSTEIKFTPQKGVFHKVFCSMHGWSALTPVTATMYTTIDTGVKWWLRALCMPKFHSIKSSVCQFSWEWHMQWQDNSYIWNNSGKFKEEEYNVQLGAFTMTGVW